VGYRLGIDLGTTSTAVARLDEHGTARPVRFGAAGMLPTAVLIDSNGAIRCGEDALSAGKASPDRLIRRFWSRIGDQVPMTVGPADSTHLRLHPQDITAAMVAWILARVAETESAAPDGVTLVHPADWGAHKLELMRRALAVRGLGEVQLLSAALVAGQAYIRNAGAKPGDAIAVLDVGGASVAAAVLRVGDDGALWPLGIPGVRADLGGVDLDDAVLRHVLDSLDPVDREGLVASGTAGAVALEALRQSCREAKERLSTATDATVQVAIAGRAVPVRLTRAEFEAAVSGLADRTVDVLREVVSGAGLRPSDLAGVMLCGGRSAVPLIAARVSTRFAATAKLARDAEPAYTAAIGAAFGSALRVTAVPEPIVAAEPAPVVSAGPSAPTRPALEVPTVMGRKPPTTARKPDSPEDTPERWGKISILPPRKAKEPAPAVVPAVSGTEKPKAERPSTGKAQPKLMATLRDKWAARPVPAGQVGAVAATAKPVARAKPVATPEPTRKPADDLPVAPLPRPVSAPGIDSAAPRRRPVRRPRPAAEPRLPGPARPVSGSVVGPRDLGSLDDLLQVPAPRRRRADLQTEVDTDLVSVPAAADVEPTTELPLDDLAAFSEQFEERTDAEAAADDVEYEWVYEWVDDPDYVPLPLWRRSLTVCRPRRVLVVVAITGALFVGSGGWRAAVPAITGHSTQSSSQSVTPAAKH
jgi:hypothetical protein